MSRESLPASAALAAFAEAYVTGRRVLVLGNALSPLPDLLLDRGARFIHVADPDGARAAQASARGSSNRLSFAPWSDGPLAFREAAFDFVLIENLGAFEPRRVLTEARRLLAPRGVVMAACPNRDVPRRMLGETLPNRVELDYYALYDAVSERFPKVRMLGQAPFVAYSVADFSPEGEIEPVIDSGFLRRENEEPEFFIALAADHRPPSEAYTLVQLPIEGVLDSAVGPAAGAEVERLREGERRHRRRIAELEGMLKRSGQPMPQAAALEHQVSRQAAWIQELEARSATADERADQAEAELEELKQKLASSAKVVEPPKAVAAILPENKERERALEKDLAEAGTQKAKLEQELATLRVSLAERDARIAALTGNDEPTDDIDALEQKLVERGQEIRRLERDVREAERVGKELLKRLSLPTNGAVSRPSPAATDPSLALRLAEAEADRLAASWAAEALALELDGPR
jgi:SAM-dependent methyltransferase